MSTQIARRSAAAVALMLTAAAATAGAQSTQTVNFQVQGINQVSFTSTPVTLTITTAVAGSDPTPVTDASSVWAITTNQSNAKISASINSAMPAGVTLSVGLAAPAGATNAGTVALTAVPQDLVTAITKVKATGQAVTYTLAATTAAGVIASDSRVVTYTLTPGT
jgi:hypothetical protein